MESLETVGGRVRFARSRKRWSLLKLAEKVGVKYQTIQDLENNTSKGSKHMVAIARELEVTPQWLQDREGPDPEPIDPTTALKSGAISKVGLKDEARRYEPGTTHGHVVEIAGTEYGQIPVYDIRFAAGHGSLNEQESLVGYYPFEMNFLRTLTDAPLKMIAGFQASGDSMEPTIFEKQWCFADLRRRNLAQPGIYALVFENEGLLKRAEMHLESRSVTLISDNKIYKPMTIKKPERLIVVGRVFASIRRH